MQRIVQQFKIYLRKAVEYWRKAAGLCGPCVPVLKKYAHLFAGFVKRSWKSIALLLPLFIFLYYAVGGWVTDKIDKNTDFEITSSEKGYAVVSAVSDLIRREVDDHMWTPNLPLIFPGYVLDNMPQFQTGIIWSGRVALKALAGKNDSPDLKKAVELLNYPGNVWLLSRGEDLKLAPSSGAQYRKARKFLIDFNSTVSVTGKEQLAVLTAVRNKLGAIDASLQKQIREEKHNWIDFKADDVFYLNQGRLYGFYVILKACGADLKDSIVAADQYQAWTSVLKTLEDGLALNPSVVRNGEADSFGAPNHLLALDYYVVKAQLQLGGIISGLLGEK